MYNSIKDNSPKPFLVINPLILEYSKRYIWGTDRDALKLFFRLCNMRIYIDGFVDDSLDGMTIYHKKIYGKDQACMRDSIIITETQETVDVSAAMICRNPVVMNPEINCADIYIYGAGYMGRQLLNFLHENSIEIKGFIDSDIEKINMNIEGVQIYSQNILKSLEVGSTVIEAGKYYQEIDLTVCRFSKIVDRYYCDKRIIWRDDKIWVNESLAFRGVIFFDKGFDNRKIYLCGKDRDLVNEYFELFELFDFANICIADWAEHVGENDKVNCIEDALFEENSLIIFCSETIAVDDINRLQCLGLERGKDFCDIRCDIWEKQQYINLPGCQGLQILDINLAYTRNMGSIYPGIAVLGDMDKNNYRIAVLGGSTSTSGYYRFKSWPEIFYERYCGNNVTLLNGAVEGYTSAQELIKLIRDIVCMKPDLVIVYDGYNDIMSGAAFPDENNIFAFPYMKTIMEYASGKIDKGVCGDRYDIFCGIPSIKNPIDVWLKNIEYMHEVCEINKIEYVAFMQPMFYSKSHISLKGDIILEKKWDFRMKSPEIASSPEKEFRYCAAEICKLHEYVFDLSYIFDEEDVYIDCCHVFEEGNAIIADEIYRILKEKCTAIDYLRI